MSVAVLLPRLAMAQTDGLQAGLEVVTALQLIGNTLVYQDALFRDGLLPSGVTVVSMQSFLREHDSWYGPDKARYEARLKDRAQGLEAMRASLRDGQWCTPASGCRVPPNMEIIRGAIRLAGVKLDRVVTFVVRNDVVTVYFDDPTVGILGGQNLEPGFPCTPAGIESKPVTTDPAITLTGRGWYPLPWPLPDTFEVKGLVRQRIVSDRDGCRSTIDDTAAPVGRGRRGPQGLVFSESWEARSVPTRVVCPDMDPPIDLERRTTFQAGKREVRLTEIVDGAHAEVSPPPPMKVKATYTLRLVPAVDEMLKDLGRCPKTSDLHTRATAGIGRGTPRIGCYLGSGETRPRSKEILLPVHEPRCEILSVLIQELSNMAQIPQIDGVREAAGRGELAREDYVRRIEELEFRGVRLRVEALDMCRSQWGCPAPELAAWQRAETFETYYQGLKKHNPAHYEFYGTEWDEKAKAAYERAHPKP